MPLSTQHVCNCIRHFIAMWKKNIHTKKTTTNNTLTEVTFTLN